jgi:hypothetical protein
VPLHYVTRGAVCEPPKFSRIFNPVGSGGNPPETTLCLWLVTEGVQKPLEGLGT